MAAKITQIHLDNSSNAVHLIFFFNNISSKATNKLRKLISLNPDKIIAIMKT